jgi:hypothetical protein
LPRRSLDDVLGEVDARAAPLLPLHARVNGVQEAPRRCREALPGARVLLPNPRSNGVRGNQAPREWDATVALPRGRALPERSGARWRCPPAA